MFLAGCIDLRFCDESSFNLEPNVPYGWCRIGEQVGIKSSKGGNLNVFGLLNLRGELTSFVSTQNINSEKIEQWEEKGLLIFYLPTYSPHSNIIETLWRKMKIEWLKPQDFKSKEDLHQAIKNILKNYNSEEYKIDFNINESCYHNYV